MVMPQPIMLSSSRATHLSRPTTLALVHMESRVSAVTVSGSSPLDLHTSMMACEEGVGEREMSEIRTAKARKDGDAGRAGVGLGRAPAPSRRVVGSAGSRRLENEKEGRTTIVLFFWFVGGVPGAGTRECVEVRREEGARVRAKSARGGAKVPGVLAGL